MFRPVWVFLVVGATAAVWMGTTGNGPRSKAFRKDASTDERDAVVTSRNSQRILANLWAIPEPTLEYHRGEHALGLRYDRPSNDAYHVPNQISSSVSLWSGECQSGGGMELEPTDGSGIGNDNDNNNNNNNEPLLVTIVQEQESNAEVVRIDLDRLWDTVNESNETTATTIDVCVRYALNFQDRASRDDGSLPDETITHPTEVNFVETVVTVQKSSTSDLGENNQGEGDEPPAWEVSVAAPVVWSPQSGHRGQHTVEHNSTILAFLCPGGNDNTPIQKIVRQGSVITLCIQPAHPGMQISEVQDFIWMKTRAVIAATPLTTPRASVHTTSNSSSSRQEGSSVVAVEAHPNRANDDANANTAFRDSILAVQQAIRDGASSDPFTVYHGCESTSGTTGMRFCSLDSLLRPDFYTAAPGLVSGTGTVSLRFGNY